jgi:lysozyme
VAENPNAKRRISSCGLKLIKSWEGLYLGAYRDPVGVWTIGYGHTNLSGVGPKVIPGLRLRDQRHAEDILLNVLAEVYEPALRRHIKVPLNQHQWDAMVTWVYNLGEGNLAKSTLLKRINQGRFEAVPAEMMKYNKARDRATGRMAEYRGLTNRRRAEAGMWRGLGVEACLPIQGVTTTAAPRADLAAPPAEPLTESDKWIERTGVLAPIVTALTSMADWKVALVLALTAVSVIAYFAWRNRQED